MRLIDSKRLAAFMLGYHVRLLESVLKAGIKGQIDDTERKDGCVEKIEHSLLVLAEHILPTESLTFSDSLSRVSKLHDAALDIGPPEETEVERGALYKLEQDILERV